MIQVKGCKSFFHCINSIEFATLFQTQEENYNLSKVLKEDFDIKLLIFMIRFFFLLCIKQKNCYVSENNFSYFFLTVLVCTQVTQKFPKNIFRGRSSSHVATIVILMNLPFIKFYQIALHLDICTRTISKHTIKKERRSLNLGLLPLLPLYLLRL